MTTQQIQIAETIRAMKAALKRRPDDSDSDSPIHAPTNRGHKLQRGSRHVREGRLVNASTAARTPYYRRKVEHAGYHRYVIAANPVLYDADGEVLDPADVGAEGDQVEVGEEDAFGGVRLEVLLRPLTSAAELPDHPGLSAPYRSAALTLMAREAEAMLRREQGLLWKAKRLLRRLRGDAEWVPCEAFEAEGDEGMLLGGRDHAGEGGEELDGDVEHMDGVDAMDMALQRAAAKAEQSAREAEAAMASGEQREAAGSEQTKDATLEMADKTQDSAIQSNPEHRDDHPSEHDSTSGRETNGAGPIHSMTTRARARSPQHSRSPSPTPSDSASIPQVHPWFLVPPSSLPDPNLGLPAAEAEETRRLLLLYTQKQEQVVRQLATLYAGLAKADRLRRDVLNACRAEGHVRQDGKGNFVTEMSDGEDWYDVEALGLGKGDLKALGGGVWGLEKGKDEVEDVEDEGRRGGRRRRVHRM